MNYNCYYCDIMLHHRHHEYRSMYRSLKCVNCFRTDLKFLNEELVEATLTGDKSKSYICLVFKNRESGCQLKIRPDEPMYISENKMTYEECIRFFKKFDNIRVFL